MMYTTTKVQETRRLRANARIKKDLLFCTIGMVITVLMCIFINVQNASAADAPMDSEALLKMANANNGQVFMVGEDEISRDVSVSELVQKYQEYREAILGPAVCMYARNNQELKVTDENVMELRNQFTYCEQEVTVHTDIISGETKVLLERVEDNLICYTLYSFDHITYQPDVYAIDRVVEFNYLGFRYVVYIENDKFQICSKWDPETGTRVYDINDINNRGDEVEMDVLKGDLKKAFENNQNVTFIEELGYYVRIHAFTEFDGIKREYIFYTYNAKPTNDVTEIVASVKTFDDEYIIYESDGWICLDSARRSGYVDHPNEVK